MAQHTFTRRAALTGAAVAATAAIAGTASVAAIPIAGSDLERHWLDRCAAFREFEADPLTPDDPDASASCWDRIDAAEVAIVKDRSGTARAAELQLWVAWSHVGPSRAAGPVSELVQQGDLAALRAIHDGLDWTEKAIFAAIVNLRREG